MANLPKQDMTNKRILVEGLASDVIITAGNGVEIPSHKCFLIANSPVFQRLLEGRLKESKTGRISMPDISEDGVRALLCFMYYGEVIGQQDCIDLAYEVLYAAHKYEISDLEAVMKTYLLERESEDFDARLAFKIYAFVRGINDAEQLKAKAIYLMRKNYDAVKELPEFKEVFLKNPADAMELCNNLVEVEFKTKINPQQQQAMLEATKAYVLRHKPGMTRDQLERADMFITHAVRAYVQCHNNDS